MFDPYHYHPSPILSQLDTLNDLNAKVGLNVGKVQGMVWVLPPRHWIATSLLFVDGRVVLGPHSVKVGLAFRRYNKAVATSMK